MEPPDTDFPVKNSELLEFYDQFAEFNDCCAFFCDALATMVGEDEPFDASTVAGIRRYCFWLKDRSKALKGELNRIRLGKCEM